MDTHRRLSKIVGIAPRHMVDAAEPPVHCGTGDDPGAQSTPLSRVTKPASRRNGHRTTHFDVTQKPLRIWNRALQAFAHCNTIDAALATTKGLLSRRHHRAQRNHSSRPRGDTGSRYSQDTGAQMRFGDYLQLLVDEQDLLRREY